VERGQPPEPAGRAVTTEGTDAVLAAVPGRLWLEETGGIVTLRNSAGRETLSTNETRAAQGIDQAFAIAATRPRITRLYVYHWQGRAGDRFDAGLIRPDGSLRPSYWRLTAHLAGQAAVTSTKIPAPRWRASWSKVDRSRLRLTVSCRATGRRCRGTVTLRVHGRKVATRRYTTTVARGAQTLRVTVPKRVRQQFRRAKKPRIVLTVRSTAPAGATATVTLRVARPKAP